MTLFERSARGRWLVAALATSLVALACAPNSPDTLFIESKTEQGLLSLAKVTARAHVQLLTAKGNSATFRNSILASSDVSVPTRGRVTVTKGAVEVRWVDVNGAPRSVRATPEAPAAWDEYIRAIGVRKSGDENGFLLTLVPLDGTPPQAEGVVIDVVYGPGARAKP